MFDPVTRQFLTTAPSLPALPAETLADEFTNAYIEIAAARLALTQTDAAPLDHMASLSERMGRIANVLESQVILDLAGPRTRAAAFVAGSARQVVFQISQLLATTPGTRIDELAISSDLAAALLFLISERTADAYEASRLISAQGIRGLHGQIAIAISSLARGQLERIVEIQPERFRPSHLELLGSTASDLLYSRLLDGTHLIARGCLGQVELSAIEDAQSIFAQVRDLAVEISPYGEPDAPIILQAPTLYPGPHHLAGLLEKAAATLQHASVIGVPPPNGANANSWTDWLKTEAARYPFLWENHQRAIGTHFLDVGQSLIMTSPTGSGKTTLSTLKIASTLCGGKTVVYLAPTHALVNQVEHDLNERLTNLARAKSVEESLLEEIGQHLPDIAVLTPERCFALLTFASELFENVGLLVFDECHLMGVARVTTSSVSAAFDRRSIDAMLCLLTFAGLNKHSDYLLLSAMVSNGSELASWLPTITGRPCASFDDKWKPTRQLKACVCYDVKQIAQITKALKADMQGRKSLPKSVPSAVKAIANASPIGLFSGGMGWHPNDPQSYAMKSLTEEPLSLGVASRKVPRRWALTANRNEVAAQLALGFYKAGLKVVVFCESIPTTTAVAKRINNAVRPITSSYDNAQHQWRLKLIEELGAVDRVYDAGTHPAAVHHGELLLEEPLLVEQLFRNRASGLNVLAATSTLAQGLNLPCEVVILAGTDRIDESDPNDTKRTDLPPHEILNALGRAGRAGLSATGLAMVVPADNIIVDLEENEVHSSPLLATIFSASDQCAPLADPITGLYDAIVAHGALSGEEDYLLKRLAVGLNSDRPGIETFEDLTRRSFGFYLRAKADTKAAEVWLEDRRQRLQTLIVAATEDTEGRDWIDELAAKSGSSPKFIVALSDAFKSAPTSSPDAYEWMSWLLQQLPTDDSDFDNFIRPDDVERVFGRGYTSSKSAKDRRERARDAIRSILPDWFAAAPLGTLENKIVAFINANEGDVKRPTSEDSMAKRGRRFALRLVSHLSYLAGVLAQVASKTAAATKSEPLAITQTLPQLVRRGFNTPYHLYLDRQKIGRSLDTEFKNLAAKIVRLPSDTWDQIRSKVEDAMLSSLFDRETIAKRFETHKLGGSPPGRPAPPKDGDK